MKLTVGELAKFLTALAGAGGEAITAGLVHGTALKVATIVIGVVTALAVFLVPNSTPPAPAKPPAP